ncbi:MAG: DUF1929 domain-containing protein [Planctomycetes bacterium]|nr:DUF1929 domain-containing protein [Planctomycetota bacterium]
MALIPKGPYRGMVFVMNRDERVIAEWPVGGGTRYVFQCYAIVDPGSNLLGGIRCRNFLLPIAAYGPVGGPLPTAPAVQDLFCSGHAWSPFGDLIVVGGTDYLPSGGAGYHGGILTYAWNPRLAVGAWPLGGGGQFYDPTSPLVFFGLWQRGPDLQHRRWYPTATLTHRLSRAPAANPLSPPRERMLVFGGTEAVPALPSPLPPALEARNSYEALVIEGEALANFLALSVDDQTVGATTVRTWIGCGTTGGTTSVDWPDEYPRCHLLSNGKLFFSGYAPRGAWLDHDGSPGLWTQVANQPGQPAGTFSANWQAERHDGSAVLFPNLGDTRDQILRVGGANGFTGPTTATTESIDAGSSSATWVEPGASDMPATGTLPDGGRAFVSLVILPTGALLAVGGQHQGTTNTPVYHPLLFEDGKWFILPANPIPSRRTYHSAPVLLADGRVFIGGGDDRDYDYEIFSPAYLDDPANRPVNPVWQAPVPFVDPRYDAYVLQRDSTYAIDFAALPLGQTITKAVLMAPGSVTHHSDMSQRYVELKTGVTNGNQVTFSTDRPETVVPRGIYMLFFVSNTSVSEAIWVMFQ